MAEESPSRSSWKQWWGLRSHPIVSETNIRSFGFEHSRPIDFTVSQWLLIKPWVFTAYRIVTSLALLVWIAVDMPVENAGRKAYIWFVYATNWSFGAVTLTFFLFAVYCLVYNCPRRNNAIYVLYQPIWFLYTIATNAMIVTSLVFWVMWSRRAKGVSNDLFAKLKHSLVAVVVLVDLWITAVPFRLVHVIYPVATGILYSMFSYFYWLGGGPGTLVTGQVYPGLNWTYPRAAILACICVLTIVFFVHIILCVLYYIRVSLSASIGGRGYAQPATKLSEDYQEFPTEDFLMDDESITGASEPRRQHSDYGAVE